MNPFRLVRPVLALGCVLAATASCATVVGVASLVSHRIRPVAMRAVVPTLLATVQEKGLIAAGRPDPPAAAGPCRLARRPSRPLDTIRLFVATAVARHHTGLSYELTTPAMRQGLSCARWETGTIPVVPMQAIDWNAGIPYHVLSESATSLSMSLRIHSRLAGFGTHFFTVTTVQQGGRWLVSYFMAADPISTPTSGR
jgi:hypothetical protein